MARFRRGGSGCRAPSTYELTAVFAAWVQSLSEEQQKVHNSRAIIVEDGETWRQLAESDHPLILIASHRLELDSDIVSRATRHGHHVLRCASFKAGSRSGTTEMPRMRRYELGASLKRTGLDEAEAKRIANASGGNFTILRRLLAKERDIQTPKWEKDGTLCPLLLAGGWEDARPADQEVIARIAGKSYDECRAVAAKWQLEQDSPVRLLQGVWEFLSPLDAWEGLHLLISPVQLKTFESEAVAVLREDWPGLDLPPEDRMMASYKGKKARYSNAMRQGMAEILAIGATREDESSLRKELGMAAVAARVVDRALSEGGSWKRWASLGDLLPSLVEAAPDVFLTAVELDLASSDSQIVEMLRQEVPPGVFGGGAYHSGLLWALESAAWHPPRLNRVSCIQHFFFLASANRGLRRRASRFTETDMRTAAGCWLAHREGFAPSISRGDDGQPQTELSRLVGWMERQSHASGIRDVSCSPQRLDKQARGKAASALGWSSPRHVSSVFSLTGRFRPS